MIQSLKVRVKEMNDCAGKVAPGYVLGPLLDGSSVLRPRGAHVSKRILMPAISYLSMCLEPR